ncbi:MAG: ABC transporter permease [Anaerolineales bacterium]|nr:ABC transporter permease [Anaerolineales bacterium]
MKIEALRTVSELGEVESTDGVTGGTSRGISLPVQIALVTRRNLLSIFRTPEALLPPLAISLFFLVIYNSTLGKASGFIPDLGSNSYLGFILPLSIVSSSLAGAGITAQNLVRDIESGYFDKLLLTPISRTALLLGPIFAGAIILGIQATVVVGVALILGLEPATGLMGLLAVIGLAVLLGTGFAGFTVSAALGSGSAAATQGASFLFFPMTFLAPTFVPLDLLDGWLATAARLNPITYVLVAMRGLINRNWDVSDLWLAVLACLGLAVVMYALAVFALRVRTRRV